MDHQDKVELLKGRLAAFDATTQQMLDFFLSTDTVAVQHRNEAMSGPDRNFYAALTLELTMRLTWQYNATADLLANVAMPERYEALVKQCRQSAVHDALRDSLFQDDVALRERLKSG